MSEKTTYTFQLPLALKKKADREAKKKDMPTSMWLRELIKNYVK